MTINAYPTPNETGINSQQHRAELARVLLGVMQGKLNNISEVTLTANAASTTVTDSRISNQSYIDFMPTTANAATELAAGTMYVSARDGDNGTFTITHANNAQTDRSFTFVIVG